MLRSISAAVMLAASGLPALAQETTPAPATAATTHLEAPVLESLEIGKAKGGLGDETASAGGYAMLSRTTGLSSGTRTGTKVTFTVNARFQKLGPEPKAKPEDLVKGKCKTGGTITGTGWNGLFGIIQEKQVMGSPYVCAFEGLDPAAYAFEVIFPIDSSTSVTPGGIMTITTEKVDPNKYKDAFLTRLVYKGVTYTAKPTDLKPDSMTRIAQGFVMSRDGVKVGQVDFQGPSRRKGVLQAPAAGSADREAVIYMGLMLLHMPDDSSPMVRGYDPN